MSVTDALSLPVESGTNDSADGMEVLRDLGLADLDVSAGCKAKLV